MDMKPIGSLPDPRGPLSDFIHTDPCNRRSEQGSGKVRAGDTKHGSYTITQCTVPLIVPRLANMPANMEQL